MDCRWRSMAILVALSGMVLVPQASAQLLSRHGDAVKIADDEIIVEMFSPLRVEVGVEGYLFTTNTINGRIIPLRAANIRVSHVERDRVTCRIIDRFRPLTEAFWFGAVFDRVTEEISTGTLSVVSSPLRATVFVDGDRRGLTPLRLDIPPGAYSLQVTLNGYTPADQTVVIVSGQASVIQVTLERIREIEEGRSADFYMTKGVVHFDMGEYRRARLYFEKAQQLMPGDEFIRDMLLRAIETLATQSRLNTGGDRAGTAEKLRQAPAWRVAARRYMSQGDYAEATGYVRNILEALPEDEEALGWWSRIASPTRERTGETIQTIRLPDGQTMALAFIRGREFRMGDQWGDGDEDEKPVHTVTLSDFWMGTHEVTNAQFAAFLNAKGNQTENGVAWMDLNDEDCQVERQGEKYAPKSGMGEFPVVEVTWYGAQAFARWVGGRLPTEAEWEFAARNGGQQVKYVSGDTLSSENANLIGTGGRDQWETSSPVGQFPSNTLGLYDMAGSVWEWCQDWYAATYYEHSRDTNPEGPSTGQARILRGGSWYDTARLCRVSYRNWNQPQESRVNIGFRVVVP